MMKIRGPAWGLMLPLFLLAASSCVGPQGPPVHKVSRLVMGTLVEVSVVGADDKAKAAAEAALDEIKRIEDLTSFHKPSGLNRLNDAAGQGAVKVDEELLSLIETALRMARETNGAYDPTIGALTRIWQFSAGEPRLPDAAQVREALGKVGWNKVVVDHQAGTVSLPEPGMALDLGGITKGYALDRAGEAIRQKGVAGALVNAGGDIRVLGEKESGTPWKIGVQDPRNPRGIIAVANVSNRVIVTSGDYERCFFQEGKRYHHILDPAVGYPAEGLQSVTILAADGITAEPLAVGVFVMGLEKGLKFIDGRPGLEGLLVDEKGEMHMTPGARSVIEVKR
jgi:FAD:protein FMN transferase